MIYNDVLNRPIMTLDRTVETFMFVAVTFVGYNCYFRAISRFLLSLRALFAYEKKLRLQTLAEYRGTKVNNSFSQQTHI